MIVPGMSLEEVKHSLFRDYEEELRMKINNAHVVYKRRWLLNGKRDTIETIHYTTRSNNHWNIMLFCTQHYVHIVPYTIAYNSFGITASYITSELSPLTFLHFNTHFFRRYRQRAKINIEDPKELVKLFFKKNLYMFPSAIEREGKQDKVFTPLDKGVGLGDYYEKDNIYEFKTFVNEELLKEEQKKLIGEIYMETITMIMGQIQKAVK